MTETQEKYKLVVNYFIDNPTYTMIDIANQTGISKSSVQRILNKDEYADKIISKTGRTIKEQLTYNLNMGKKKGGKNSFQYNIALKDDNGKFIGSVENYDYIDNEEIKQQDIELIVDYYCTHSTDTLESIVEQINDKYNKKYTKAYVYNCLLDQRVEALFEPIVSEEIKNQLSNNYQGFFKKFGFISMDLETLSKYDLTDREIAILLYRFNNGKIKSTQEAAQHFNCSKTVITKIEDKALEKITGTLEEEDCKIRC